MPMPLKPDQRSACPINMALEILGDRWSLLIVRDLMFMGRRQFGDFLAADEKIATNILSNRLACLARDGIIESLAGRKRPAPGSLCFDGKGPSSGANAGRTRPVVGRPSRHGGSAGSSWRDFEITGRHGSPTFGKYG